MIIHIIPSDVLSALFLYIKEAFPSIILNKLTHCMRHREIPQEYTRWIEMKVEGCRTTLCFNDHTTEEKVISQGMDQGCPLSGITYQFYNADLLGTTRSGNKEDSIAFIDDAVILAEGDTLEVAFQKC